MASYISKMKRHPKAKKQSGRDCDSRPVVGMIGYGSQGRALTLNLIDSGYRVLVGLRTRSKSRRRAIEEGVKTVLSPAEAVRQADIVCMAFPDHLHRRVYNSVIEKNLKPGATLLFLHGMSIHFGLVCPPVDSDVVLIAPHAPGVAVREKFLTDRSVSAFYAIARDSSGKVRQRLFDLASAMGFQKQRLLKTTFADEAIGDIFGEQVVLCGGLPALIKNAFEVLVDHGLGPENAYLEVVYQLDLIVDLIKRYGIEGMYRRISVTARYGSAQHGPKVVDQAVKKRMERILRDVKSGKFATELSELTAPELKRLNRRIKDLSHPDLEKAARKFAP